jgi:hypothetical protein
MDNPTVWTCSSCDAQFPKRRGDETTQRCSSCVALDHARAELARLQADLASARAERASDIAAHKRLLAKVEAVSFAHAEQAVLLARIEALARAGDVRGVVEAIVRQAEKGF